MDTINVAVVSIEDNDADVDEKARCKDLVGATRGTKREMFVV